MPSNLVSQVEFLTNLISKINDAVAGGTYSGTGAANYGSQVGARWVLGNDEPRLDSALAGGAEFQYVQFYKSQTATPVVGQLAFWQNAQSYVVTCDEPTGVSDIGGVVVSATTKGNFGVIVIDGQVNVLFRATITKATPAVGDLVLAAAAGAGVDNGLSDVLIDAATMTPVQIRHVLGVAITAPAGGAKSAVRLRGLAKNF